MGLVTALAVGVGTMMAAGIFTLSGLAIRNVGSAAIVSFLLAAMVALFTALTYCEFASIYPESGEGYLYARRTFRPVFAYFVGWALCLGYTSSCAFYISSLSSYFAEFVYGTRYEIMWGVAALASPPRSSSGRSAASSSWAAPCSAWSRRPTPRSWLAPASCCR